MRVYHGHHASAMARIALFRLGPNMDTSNIAKSIGGKLRKISVMRMIISSTAPPDVPATAPSGTPITNDRATARTAVLSDILVP